MRERTRVRVEIVKELHKRGLQPKDIAVRLGYANANYVLRVLRRAGIELAWGFDE